MDVREGGCWKRELAYGSGLKMFADFFEKFELAGRKGQIGRHGCGRGCGEVSRWRLISLCVWSWGGGCGVSSLLCGFEKGEKFGVEM